MNGMGGDAIRALVAALADVVIEADRGKAALVIAQLAELKAHWWLRLDELTPARADLLAWLQDGAATSYGQPDAGQAAEIARFLATSKLSDRQRREIAFVAGLRVPASGSQPG